LWQQLFCSNPALHLGYLLLVPALGCACLSYYLVEQPMLALREKRRTRLRPFPSIEETEIANQVQFGSLAAKEKAC
jgi:peptidoglycan/LPS O-acetylase OafA/YrhL